MEITMDDDQKIVITKVTWLTNSLLMTGCGDGAIRTWDLGGDGTNLRNVPTAASKILQTEDKAEIRDMEHSKIGTDKLVSTVAAGTKVYFLNLTNDSLIHVYKMPIHFKDKGGASYHLLLTKFIAMGSDLWVRVFDFTPSTGFAAASLSKSTSRPSTDSSSKDGVTIDPLERMLADAKEMQQDSTRRTTG
jgi:serine-threonine kinase receptor-associated protein